MSAFLDFGDSMTNAPLSDEAPWAALVQKRAICL